MRESGSVYGASVARPTLSFPSLLTLLCSIALVATACGGATASSDDLSGSTGAESEPAAEVEPADEGGAEEPTSAKDPTTEPDPTAAPVVDAEPAEEAEPTAEPEPDPVAVTVAVTDDRFTSVTERVARFVEERGLNGAGLVVVDRQDGVIHHSHYGEFSEDRISMIASTSKMISAGVLLRLDDQGVFDIDAPLSEYVDWAGDHPEMTAAQLVSNSSGLVGLGPNIFYSPYICQWMAPDAIQDCAETVLTAEGDDADVVAPDSEYRYGGAQWQVAGGIAEAVSGKTWSELIDETYNAPCDIDSLGYISLGQVNAGLTYPIDFGGDPDLHAESANPNIEGGAHIDTGDYAKLLLMQLNGGECPGGQVLSVEALATMHTDRVGPTYGADLGGDGYGMGWWVDHETGILTDPGAWGAISWLNLAEGYGGYWVIEDQGSTTESFRDELLALIHLAVT